MRLNDIATIYLAMAAPVGVSLFLQRQPRVGRRRALLLALVAALVWPLTLAMMALVGAGSSLTRETTDGGADEDAADEGRIEHAKRALLDSLDDVEELTEHSAGAPSEATRRVAFTAREAIERYVGLSLASAEASAEAAPSSREMELCRAAGRRGDDLIIAGRCTHRRNTTRLFAHRDRARSDLIHALAQVRENLPPALGADTLQRLSELLLRFYGRAVDLLSLLNDQRAVLGAARLLDAEGARLRSYAATARDVETARGANGGELCATTDSPNPSLVPPPPLPQRTAIRARS